MRSSYGQGGGVNIAKNDLVDKSLNILAGYNNQWGDFSFRAQVGYHQQENGRESISLYGSKFYVIDFYALANCDDDTKVSVRPSGTEPKIKFYIEVKNTMKCANCYDRCNEEGMEQIEAIKKSLKLD